MGHSGAQLLTELQPSRMAPCLSLIHWASQEVSVCFFFNVSFAGKVFAEDFFLCGQSENHLGAVGVNADPWAPPGPGELAAAEAGGGICICDTLPRNSEATLQSETHCSTGLGRVSQGAKWREC